MGGWMGGYRFTLVEGKLGVEGRHTGGVPFVVAGRDHPGDHLGGWVGGWVRRERWVGGWVGGWVYLHDVLVLVEEFIPLIIVPVGVCG